MLRLNNLQPSGKKRKRIGRGGERGGTSGRGHKGQNARSGGKSGRGFEGGQTPLNRRLPKRGFTNARFAKEVSVVNIDRLDQTFVDGDEISLLSFIEKGLIKPKSSEQQKIKQKIFVKILGDGKLNKKLTIFAHAFSEAAINAIQTAGGTVNIIKEL